MAIYYNSKPRGNEAEWYHNMIVFMNSDLKNHLEHGIPNSLSLDDSEYALEKLFMTSLGNPITIGEIQNQKFSHGQETAVKDA